MLLKISIATLKDVKLKSCRLSKKVGNWKSDGNYGFCLFASICACVKFSLSSGLTWKHTNANYEHFIKGFMVISKKDPQILNEIRKFKATASFSKM